MRPSSVYCSCGLLIGKDHHDTWHHLYGWEPGFYDGIEDYYSERLGRYFCSQECLDEYEEGLRPEEEE